MAAPFQRLDSTCTPPSSSSPLDQDHHHLHPHPPEPPQLGVSGGSSANAIQHDDPSEHQLSSGTSTPKIPSTSTSSGHTSDSNDSAGSLGGLNHVNDGIGDKSTTHRRMSRVWASDAHPKPLLPYPITTNTTGTAEAPLGLHENDDDDPLSPASSSDQDDLDSPELVIVTSPRRNIRMWDRASTTATTTGLSPHPRRLSRSGPGTGWSSLEAGLPSRQESSWKRWLRRHLPIYGWLVSPGYNVQDLPDDIIAGITLSTVLIPQAMAYAMLAPLPPVYGLYTSVVPILIYCLVGTSRHMHTGTFAITTLLLGQAVRELLANKGATEQPQEQLFIGMILLLSFVVGVIQVVLSFVGAGRWASKHLLPDSLVGGFNTAAVFHIGTSQLQHFLGIAQVPSSQGAFALIKTWGWFARHLWTEANWYTVGLGVLAIVLMMVFRAWERRRKQRHEQARRRAEMKMVQERQALSEAISRVREEQRRQQFVYQQQQQQQQQYQQLHQHPLHGHGASQQAASNISLRTMADEHVASSGPSPVPRHTPSEAEQALTTTLNEAEVAASKLDDPMTAGEVAAGVMGTTLSTSGMTGIYIPIPDILLSVILLTVLNVVFGWDRTPAEGGLGIAVIGEIPKGLPQMAFPASLVVAAMTTDGDGGGASEWMTLQFLKEVVVPMLRPALLIAFVIYVMSFSIAKQFGKRYGYKVDANQEMLALGLASMGGSCFSGYACTGSLTRTAILSQSGGKTPLASLVGVGVVMLTLVWLTWCFERVPNTVLAAIVLVALQSLISQVYEPIKLWKVEGRRADAMIWVVTFLGVWVISVEIGIFVGMVVVIAVKLGVLARQWLYPGTVVEPRRGSRRWSSASARRYSRGAAGGGGDQSRYRRGSVGATQPLLPDSGEDRTQEGGDEQGGQVPHYRRASGSPFLSQQQQQHPRRLSAASRHLRRRTPSSSVLDAGGFRGRGEGANWKQRFLSTPWGQRIGSWIGMERPFLTDSIHTFTDDDDY